MLMGEQDFSSGFPRFCNVRKKITRTLARKRLITSMKPYATPLEVFRSTALQRGVPRSTGIPLPAAIPRVKKSSPQGQPRRE